MPDCYCLSGALVFRHMTSSRLWPPKRSGSPALSGLDDAETVPSRWLNRLQNLLNGLPEQGGRNALSDMIARGDAWLLKLRALETVTQTAKGRTALPAPAKSRAPAPAVSH